MKRNFLVCIGILTVALTAGAQMPGKSTHKKTSQKATAYREHRAVSSVRQTTPRRTYSARQYRQPSFSNARSGDARFRTTQVQPRRNSFTNRPATTSNAARRQSHPTFTGDRTRSRFSPRPRSAFVNRPTTTNAVARKQTHIASANDWRGSRLGERSRTSSASLKRFARNTDVARGQTRWDADNRRADSRFKERPRPSSSLLKPFTTNDVGARQKTRAEFSNRNKWTNSNLSRQVHSSFVNRSVATTTAIREQRRAAFSNNWRGDWFAGRQYGAFRNYRRQWHDRGWWHDHCDRIVFVTVYSQPFPFYFNAGYWYPAWGYYANAYYPYDGPIYCYNDLPPDEIVTNVQAQLYDEGYYAGPIDGILGPDTRAAIADYQADHGLAVTAAIDEPTVESLGLA
jgi:Putative peptidoglycan binding domain